VHDLHRCLDLAPALAEITTPWPLAAASATSSPPARGR
jgi:hypothetical protein